MSFDYTMKVIILHFYFNFISVPMLLVQKHLWIILLKIIQNNIGTEINLK